MTPEQKDRAICGHLEPEPECNLSERARWTGLYSQGCPAGCWVWSWLKHGKSSSQGKWQPRNTLEPEMTVLMKQRLFECFKVLSILYYHKGVQVMVGSEPVPDCAVQESTEAEAVQSAYLKAFGLEI